MRWVKHLLDPPDPTMSQDEMVDAINAAVRGPHKIEVKVWSAPYDTENWALHPLVDPGTAPWQEVSFEILSGQVTEHLRDPVTRELSLEIASDFWNDPFDAIQEVSPYKTLLAVARGIVMPDGVYWIPLGVYRVRSLSSAGNAQSAVSFSVQGYSMEVDIRDSRFLKTPFAGTGAGQIGATAVRDIVHRMVEQAFPNTSGGDLVIFDIESEGSGLGYNYPAGTPLSEERDRLDAILNFLEPRNVWGRFNRDNTFLLSTTPMPSDPAANFIIDGGPQGVLVSYSKEYNRDGVYNAVLAFGEFGTDALKTPVSFLAKDMNPTSVTYWDGPYGHVPRFYYHPALYNDAASAADQVEAAALNILAQAKNFPAGINFESVPNPLLEAGDVVEIRYPVKVNRDGEVETEVYVERHLLHNITIGLGADTTFTAESIVDAESLPDEATMLGRVDHE